MSTGKSLIFGFLAVISLCAAALLQSKEHEPAKQLAQRAIPTIDADRPSGPTTTAHIGEVASAPAVAPQPPIAAAKAEPSPENAAPIVGPTATPAELGYSPQAIYDAQQYNNQMQYAPKYDQYGQQVIEDQGAASYVYDPDYGYGYGFGYGPVTNSGEAAFNGPAYAPAQR